MPVFNEHGNIGVLAKAIDRVFANLPYTYTLLFVDDGSIYVKGKKTRVWKGLKVATFGHREIRGVEI